MQGPFNNRLRLRETGTSKCALSQIRPRLSQDAEAYRVPNLPKSIDRGVFKTPDDTIWCQPRGMAEDRATDSRDSRYHDVAGRDEKKNLFRQ